MQISANVRNVVIILALAGVVAVLPGGGSGANTVLQAVQIAFLTAIGWFAMMMYRQHRTSLYSLGDKRRALLYAAAGVALLALTANQRLTATAAGTLVFVILLVAAAYTIFAVIWSAREY
jgi:ABC-type phosphonate transport system ATPase subunit